MASLNVSISPGRRFFPSLNIAGWHNPSPPKARAQQGRFKHPCRTSQLARRAGKGSARVCLCVWWNTCCVIGRRFARVGFCSGVENHREQEFEWILRARFIRRSFMIKNVWNISSSLFHHERYNDFVRFREFLKRLNAYRGNYSRINVRF